MLGYLYYLYKIFIGYRWLYIRVLDESFAGLQREPEEEPGGGAQLGGYGELARQLDTAGPGQIPGLLTLYSLFLYKHSQKPYLNGSILHFINVSIAQRH